MSYTIADVDELVEDTGWDVTYIPYKETEEKTERVTGWHEFEEHIEVSRKRWNDDTREFDPIPESEIEYKHIEGFGHFDVVESFGGEGEGDQYWFVFKITDDNGEVRYFRRNGWYASFDGGYYDGPTEEVVAQEKTIIVWVKK
ncbi:hypothetical protein I3U64_00365 [Mycobacteroides abscessus subsp. abscessus]|uniref:hypothetical protein n=1 Tax=Mycobacteroides abscessus TaxID=36809 RepID=UPI0005E3FD68|nr:hypothetical protein [Mycobacteroides abscessus]QSM02370.1 hypothetical protein PROPHIGD86-1_96 [Mycobacterium phage prophi86-1]MBN7458599.1 hypothetical protein [Mycobacteroides abscessus subsp. abscessus]CPS09911.1 Uncharacterised protein [Mycobacteroides abscessus]CPU99138.1 Uncharacterised protein [Mycobacteroides abscessus]SLJ45577.1 Uncharacterised protein [Mycobacteroides abscessus subsp. abscessus]